MSHQLAVTSFCFPRRSAVVRAMTRARILLAVLALSAVPARGQITSSVDGHGKRVYVNDDRQTPRRPASSKRTGQAARGQSQNLPGVPGVYRAPRYAPREGLEQMVNETAERHRIDPALIRAVIAAESNWNPWAVSRKGAVGLMQLAPWTAVRLGVSDAFDPRDNLNGGVLYLRKLLERYGGDLNKSLAAYNAGEGAVDRARGVPNIAETRTYVQTVTDYYFRLGSGRSSSWWQNPRPIYRITNERGRIVYTNE